MDIESDDIDAVRFERLSAEGRRLFAEGDSSAAAAVLREGLGLWRGAALVDFVDDEFSVGDRTRLEVLRIATLEQRVDADLALGLHDEVIAELEQLIVEHPLRERFRAQLMLALYRCGRQTDALRAFQAARRFLGEEIGVEPCPELQQLEAAILAQDVVLDPPTRAASPAQQGNLPSPISSFVGRATELAQVQELLEAHRIVTLVGTGGAGKTRLAIEAGNRARSEHPGGSWFVELAGIADPEHVDAAALTALGLDDIGRLDDFFANRRALIVLDNCEHVVAAAAELSSRLLRSGEGVTVLATSREGLGVGGERRWTVPPLAPADAATLFMTRALDGGHDVADRESVVAEICDRLDGLPLAVELAAARTRTLSLDDVASRLDDRFRLLTSGERTAQPRQQTLRGVVDWSYDLLFSDEQRVFRRLSVFVGGFGLRAAELVAAGDDVSQDDVLDLIGHLVDKSLVTVTSRKGETRYHLLQTLIEYGTARLSEAGEAQAARDRHLAWMVELSAEAGPELQGFPQQHWVGVITTERDNIRAAVEWALKNERPGDAAAIVANVAYGWFISGAVNDGRLLLDTVLARAHGAEPEHLAVAHAWAAWLSQFAGGVNDAVVDHAEQSLVFARVTNSRVFALTAVIASMVRGYLGRTDQAAAVAAEADQLLDRHPDRWGQAWVDWVQCGLALKLGEPERASSLLRRSVEGFEAEGDRCAAGIAAFRLSELAEARGADDEAIAAATMAYEATQTYDGQAFNSSTSATRLGNLAVIQGRFADGAAWHAKALATARERAYPGAIAQALSGAAWAAARQGLLDDAERGHLEALAMYETARSVEGIASALAALGFIATARGDQAAARDLHLRSLREASRGSDRRAISLALQGLAAAHAGAGDGHQAALLLGVAAAIARSTGGPLPTVQTHDTERTLEQVRELVGPEHAAASQAEGDGAHEQILAGLLAGLDPQPA